MDPFQKIQSYQARRGNIFKLLEEYGSLTIEGMKGNSQYKVCIQPQIFKK